MRSLSIITIGLGGLIGLGCGAGSPGASLAPSEAVARELTTACLEAWQQGKAEGLAGLEPPIRFYDPDMAAKSTLVAYSLGESARSFGHIVEIPASLEIKDRRGRTRTVDSAYQIAVEPAATVLRADPDE
ncbi:MAG: hypothetical protein U0800_18330 [Isosphaeraceae bacterium]